MTETLNGKQKIAIIAPIALVAVMCPVFRVLAGAFGENWRIAWYLGLVIYWLIWGGIFSWLMIGKDAIGRIIRPQKLTIGVFVLVLLPVLMASLYRFIPGMGYEKPSWWIFLLLVSTTVGNGFFEEVLWRGVYMVLFPEKILFRIVWPSIWFALWHYAPGSISPTGNVVGLIIGAGFMGFYLSFVAKKTETIWWGMLAHATAGLVMIG
jgi:membrane protease YdiL (CAAX protease family)